MFQLNVSHDDTSSTEDSDDEHMVLVVQSTPSSQSPQSKKKRTMRFNGFIGKQEILILLDSGNAGTFISSEVANSIQQSQQICDYSAADGSPMISNRMIPKLTWFMQGHSFAYDTRVLPLKCYDMILGADWLEDYTPTWVHWKKKLMRFPHNGRRIQLQGVKDDLSRCTAVSAHKLQGLLKKKAVTHCIQLWATRQLTPSPMCAVQEQLVPSSSVEQTLSNSVLPESVKTVVLQHAAVFQSPSTFPPSRAYDHHITLVPGAQPVNVRPYKYAPHQKSEIERQIEELLQSGIIQQCQFLCFPCFACEEKRWLLEVLC